MSLPQSGDGSECPKVRPDGIGYLGPSPSVLKWGSPPFLGVPSDTETKRKGTSVEKGWVEVQPSSCGLGVRPRFLSDTNLWNSEDDLCTWRHWFTTVRVFPPESRRRDTFEYGRDPPSVSSPAGGVNCLPLWLRISPQCILFPPTSALSVGTPNRVA